MPRGVPKGELTANETKFATLIVMGENQSDAYRKAFKTKAVNEPYLKDRASRLANTGRIINAKKTILSELKQEDLDSVGATMLDLLRYMTAAETDKNWTALAAFSRLRMAAKGMLSETVVVRAEQSMTDETLVKQLAKGDQAKAATLTALLGGKRAA